MAAGKINLQKASGGVTAIIGVDGTGNTEVVLPESGTVASVDTSVTDNAIARYDGTTGKLQNSAITIDDVGNMGSGTQTFNGFGGTGFKNYIINCGMDIWQRGTSFIPELNSLTYTADRFQVVIMGAQKNVTREILDASYINKYGLGINGTNSATNAYVTTRLEHIHTHKLHGKKINVSCKVYATNSGTMAINIDRPTVVDTYNATQTIHSENINLTSGVNNISFSVSLDSISSTFGLQLAFIFGALTSNDNRILADVQLEEGSVATPFENRPYGLELSLCQRYYQVYGDSTQGIDIIGYSIAGQTERASFMFPIQMRDNPNATRVGTWYTGNCSQPTIATKSKNGFSLQTIVAATGGFEYTCNGTGQYLIFEKEL